MPELPEVETIARGLNTRVAGDTIESVWIGSKPEVLKSPAKKIAGMLEGRRIELVRRVGKHIVVDLDGDGRKRAKALAQARPQWIVHLGMTGRLLISRQEDEIEKHTHLVAKLASGRELRYVDPRRFGRLSVTSGFEAPGAEPLKIDLESFIKLFRGRKTPIKSALLNQSLLSGVGNIYADEALFRSGIRPRRRAASLTRDDLSRLHKALREVLKEAIRMGGSSISDYVDSNGDEGFFQLQHRVYGREGEPCLICKTPVKRLVIAGRSAHYCRKCQK